MVAGAAAAVALRVSGARLAIGAFACVLGIGLLGTWDVSMITLTQVLASVALTVAIAIPIGVLTARNDRLEGAIRPVLDAMQTMPAFVYLVPVFLLFAPGRVPGVIASVIYALPVGIRLTSHGIRSVPKETVEAAESLRRDATSAPVEGAVPLGPPIDPARGEPDDHDGARPCDHRRADRRGRPRFRGPGGTLEAERSAAGSWRGLSILLLAVVLDRITQSMGTAPSTLRGPVGLMGRLVAPPAGDRSIRRKGRGKHEDPRLEACSSLVSG